jgi:hypothetical protein
LNTKRRPIQLDESFDADAILREPGDNIEEEKEEEEEVSELNFGDLNRIKDLDIPENEEGFNEYGL